ncbi:hypothetical protein [Vibrio phage phiKT1024]|nr:hypothetical protein [Vibrio phage phiKT1024]
MIVNKPSLKSWLYLTVFYALLTVVGCSSPIEVKKEEQERVQLNLQDTQPVKMKDLDWIIITPENYQEVFDELESKNYKVVIFGLTERGYEDLSINMEELKGYIIEQSVILGAYREYYEGDKKSSE